MTRKQVDDVLIRSQIEALIAEFAYLIDHNKSEKVAELFTEDGWYGRQDGTGSRGREEIAKAYSARRNRGERVARHIFTNLYLHDVSEKEAHGTCILTLYAADGPPPHPAKPVLVQDYEDIYCFTGDRWRFRSRKTLRLFADEDYASVLNLSKKTRE